MIGIHHNELNLQNCPLPIILKPASEKWNDSKNIYVYIYSSHNFGILKYQELGLSNSKNNNFVIIQTNTLKFSRKHFSLIF